MSQLKALTLLSECTGDDLWSIEHCKLRGVPEAWLQDLSDCFESGFRQDSETIYVDQQPTNQYEGIRDVDLAIRIAEFLGIDVATLAAWHASRSSLVRAIQEAAEEA